MINVNDKDLGQATAYAYAVSKGYTGTEEEFAQLMANYATVGETATEAAEQAGISADYASADAIKAEGNAVGEQNGEPVDSDSPYYHNNAKYYAEEAKDSETNAGNSESAASGSASDAEANALKSEGHAVGTQDGTAVGSDSPYYQNNSKYYSEQSAASAATSAAMTGLAPAFSTSKAYAAGDYVLYNGTLYRFTAAHAAGAWTGSDATAVTLGPDVTDLKSALNDYTINVGNLIPLTSGYIQTNQAVGATVPISSPVASDTLSYGVVDCTEGDIFILYGSGENVGRLWAVVDSDNKMVYKSASNLSADGLVVRVPADSAKFIVNTTRCAYIGNTIRGQIDTLSQMLPSIGYSWITNAYLLNDGTVRTGASGRYCSEYIPCADNATVKYVGETNKSNIYGIAFYDIEKNCIGGYANNGTKGTEITVTSPAKTAYCRISTDSATIASSYVIVANGSLSKTLDKVANVPDTIFYISPGGSDSTGDGSVETPFATVNKALLEGGKKIMVKQGVYAQRVDFSNAKEHDITIVSYEPTGKAVFIAPDAFITDTEVAESGYTKVYSCSYSGTLSTGMRLYQDGVPDVDTEISNSERNPYERGQAYRCLDTKILPCTSNNLSDALTEIENANGYKYYHDTDNNVLYYSRPQAVTSSYPIMRTVNTTFFYNLDRTFKLSLYGIECKYMRFDISQSIAHLEDCKCSYAYGSGGFIYGKCMIEFVRCESCGTHGNETGDGFNAHSSSTGDKHSKQTVARLVDCWSHDSLDDGYSDHERSETEIWGGLFEYNGKAGITPAYGTHCSCYNVISRNNYSGFLYLGEATAEEGGMYGQMLCVGCIAENNTDNASGYGYAVKGTGNLIKLINSLSIGNNIGFYGGVSTIMELINCGISDCTTEKTILGTLNVVNTDAVTAS